MIKIHKKYSELESNRIMVQGLSLFENKRFEVMPDITARFSEIDGVINIYIKRDKYGYVFISKNKNYSNPPTYNLLIHVRNESGSHMTELTDILSLEDFNNHELELTEDHIIQLIRAQINKHFNNVK